MNKLLLDIETSKMTVRTFSLYPDSINYEDIIKDWHIISIAYKWVGDAEVHVLTKTGSDNDYYLVKKFHKILQKADLIIGHNIDKFDYPKLLSRIIYHGLPPLPKLTTYDTLKAARKAAFTSRRLDYLLDILADHRKLDNPKGLWNAATDGCKKAIAHMVEYNKQDVVLLEELYNILQPYNLIPHPNENLFNGTTDSCPHCSSTNVIKRGFQRTKIGVYQRYQCNDCGGWSQGKTNLFKGGAEVR